MLVVTRKQRERILIGDSVVITVVRMQGDRVRLGIQAPADVRILREELVASEDEDLAPRQAATSSLSPSVLCYPESISCPTPEADAALQEQSVCN